MKETCTYEEYCEFVKKLNKLRYGLNKCHKLKNTSYISDDIRQYESISIYDLYYILKFYGVKINDRLKRIEKKLIIDYIDPNTLEQLRSLNIKDDDRILVMPPEIVFHPALKHSFHPILMTTDGLNISDSTIAFYLTNYSQLVAITRALANDKENYNLLMKNYLYETLPSSTSNYIKDKITVIDDDITYNDLSSVLDSNNKVKIKTKF